MRLGSVIEQLGLKQLKIFFLSIFPPLPLPQLSLSPYLNSHPSRHLFSAYPGCCLPLEMPALPTLGYAAFRVARLLLSAGEILLYISGVFFHAGGIFLHASEALLYTARLPLSVGCMPRGVGGPANPSRRPLTTHGQVGRQGLWYRPLGELWDGLGEPGRAMHSIPISWVGNILYTSNPKPL